MESRSYFCEITAVGSDDEKHTYEIIRKVSDSGKKVLIIELYPTLSISKAQNMDLSTMHLLNHATELGWGDIHIVNLYSTVFESKPTITELATAENSIAYIEDFLDREDIAEYEIVIGWGSALAKHKQTMNLKIDILSILKDRGLDKNVKCLSTENLVLEESWGVHPLYLGLHYGKETWEVTQYPIEEELEKLNANLKVAVTKQVREKKTKKGGKKDVSAA